MTFPSATEYLNIYETQKGTFTVIAHIEGLGRRTVASLAYHSESLLSFGFENEGNVYLVPAGRIIAFELD